MCTTRKGPTKIEFKGSRGSSGLARARPSSQCARARNTEYTIRGATEAIAVLDHVEAEFLGGSRQATALRPENKVGPGRSESSSYVQEDDGHLVGF